ncbi:Stk1 family PASTA domain-containing Ser/Thr kinase [Timonella sp. A28]|uniref:Stk1 family PASTA domain-containing Ser/Thr kinase n=1 Tax=Timonella sp. A28 TaxID=3442640 RepID=UPI003EBF7577
MVNPVPRTLAGRYEVGELIGRGGMAEVHIGHDNRLGRTVAIKILRSDLARDPSFQARFRREAQAAASLNHPAIVAVYDTGEDTHTEATGAVSHIPFIVMEYVEGHTVRDILRDGNAVPIEEAIEITSGVLSALEYSHHAGIVHRDIKPANVMLTPNGAVKVMDFGIARAVADSAATMTQTHAVIGTAQYLSPEQARGETVDTRSDLYSTGCLLYELLTGRPPFTGDSPVAVAYQHVRELAAPPSTVAPDVPHVLDQITLMALAKDRNERYSTAAEFRAALEAAARGEMTEATAAFAAIPAANDPQATQIIPQHSPATQAIPSFAAGAAAAGAAQATPWQQSPSRADLFENNEEEDEKDSKKKLIWTLVTVGIVALLAIIAFAMLNGDKEPPIETLTVPSMAGLTEEEAVALLKEKGFTETPVINQERSNDVDAGIFTRSNPDSGSSAPADAEIQLWFSTGPDAVEVPDVVNMTQEEARDALDKVGLGVASVKSISSATVEKDKVVRSDPEPGKQVAVGRDVILYVADGFASVPDVVGKTESEAEKILEDAGLQANFEEEESSEVEAGKVIRQSPTAGSSLEQGKDVTVIIAKEAEPEPVTLRDLTGWSYEDAANEINRLGGEVDENLRELNDNQIPEGNVIRTIPGPGTPIYEGDTVTLYISLGPIGQSDPTDPGTGGGDLGGGEEGEG